VDKRTVYALQEFHGIVQADLSITDYFGRLKQLADLLHGIGHPIPEPSLVINALRGLNSKFSQAISMITAMKPLPSFLHVRNYLLQEETHRLHTAKMEAATTLMAISSKSTPTAPKQSSLAPPRPSSSPNKNNNKSRKRRKQSDDTLAVAGTSSQASTKSTPTAQYNPWTGLVQAWPLLQWRPATLGLLGTCPPFHHQALLAAAPGSASGPYYGNSASVTMALAMNSFFGNTAPPPGLPMALNTMVPSAQYQGGD
jgi:hypothetical protein